MYHIINTGSAFVEPKYVVSLILHCLPPKKVIFLPCFSILLPTTAHFPFAVAFFAVGGSRGEEGEEKVWNVFDQHFTLHSVEKNNYSQFLSVLDSVQQDGDLQEEKNQRFSVTLKL